MALHGGLHMRCTRVEGIRRFMSAAVIVLVTVSFKTSLEARARQATGRTHESAEQQAAANEQADAQQAQQSSAQGGQSSESTEQSNDPVRVNAEITVFGEAEPSKTDLSPDVRSLPNNASLLQGVEINRKTWREP